jgi:alginate O-acetyltransferase complex protein AlgI
MIFNSIEFAIFFPIIFLFYWLVFQWSLKGRNLFIIAASYFFYGVWDWRFLSLIFISSLVDFIIGNLIFKEEDSTKRKRYLALSLISNLGILIFFKYFNFFIDSFSEAFSLFGATMEVDRLNIILPVGISFYTFQTLSYTIDIYRKKLEPTKDPLSFFAFVSFFPQLVAGPIERAKDLLPQFYSIKKANYQDFKSGLIIVGTGLFQKIVIADRLAIYVDGVFGNLDGAQGLPMVLGAVFFAFQLYLDFSAYSLIAIGLAKTLGFQLSTNFARPYFAGTFSDFWNRWHISLSSWFRDYLYIPLGGSKNGSFNTKKNILIVFILSGLWHGASWSFVIWGVLNGLFLICLDPLFTYLNLSKRIKPLLITCLWTFSLVFFRAPDFGSAFKAISQFGFGSADKLYDFGLNITEFKLVMLMLALFIVFEAFQEKGKLFWSFISRQHFFVRYSCYIGLILTILFLGSYGVGVNDNNFIYFQF